MGKYEVSCYILQKEFVKKSVNPIVAAMETEQIGASKRFLCDIARSWLTGATDRHF